MNSIRVIILVGCIQILCGCEKDSSLERRANDGEARAEAAEKQLSTLREQLEKSTQRLSQIEKQRVDELLQSIETKDVSVIRTRILELGQMGADAKFAVPGIQTLLEHEDATVRRDAAYALRKIDATWTTRIYSWALALIVHLISIALMCGIGYFVVQLCVQEHDSLERAIRAGMGMSAILLFTGSKALGLSVPSLIQKTTSDEGFSSFLVAGALGGVAGAATSWFSVRMMNRDSDRARRITILCLGLVLAVFADTYSIIAGELSWQDIRFGLPNITFVAGFILWIGFTYSRNPEAKRVMPGLRAADV